MTAAASTATANPASRSGRKAPLHWSRRPWVRRGIFLAALLPLLWLAAGAVRGRLGANPIEYLLNRLGWWTLVLLLASLACTPLRIVTGASWPVSFRRTLGLFAFFYACVHFLFYVGVDRFFDLRILWEDVVRRKFMTIGFAALCLLIPLALTSTKGSIRRMGARRWRRLHRLVYLAAVLGVIHFIWRVKADLREPLIFAGVLALFFAVRLWERRRGRTRPRRGEAAA